MPNCKDCGAPLTKGNIQVVRPRGKKRPYRIHRRCPEVVEVTALGDRRHSFVPVGNTAGDVVQRPQDSTGDPLVVEGILEYSEPPRYRYFMTQEQAARVKLAVERAWGALGIGFEVIPVPEDQVERAPEDYADLVEVTVKWKDE